MDPHVEFDYRGRHVTLLYSMDVLFDAYDKCVEVCDNEG